MRILVFNAGSSSLKFGVFDLSGDSLADAQERCRGTLDRFGPEGCDLKLSEQAKCHAAPRDLAQAAALVPELLAQQGLSGFDAIAHRIAHGGARFDRATRLDRETLEAIRALTPLAPLQNPPKLGARPGCGATGFTARRTNTWRSAQPRRCKRRCAICGWSACTWATGRVPAPLPAGSLWTAPWG